MPEILGIKNEKFWLCTEKCVANFDSISKTSVNFWWLQGYFQMLIQGCFWVLCVFLLISSLPTRFSDYSTRRNCSINCDSISQPLLLRYFEVRINGTKRKFLILFYLYDQMQTPPLFIVIFGIQEAGRGIGLHSRPLSPLPAPQLLCFYPNIFSPFKNMYLFTVDWMSHISYLPTHLCGKFLKL